MRSTVIAMAIRQAISAALAVSGVIHAYLYVNGYRDIPMIGPGFLVQAIVFCVLALLILAGGPDWLRCVAGVLSAGPLVAFALYGTIDRSPTASISLTDPPESLPL
jgi:hypothetical protein